MAEYETSKLLSDLEALGISIDDEKLSQLMKYYEMLIETNKVMNLTAITEFDDVMKKHFVDSLSIVKTDVFKEEASLIDIGTGAGFPGLVLKIVFPALKVTLLDSLNKRINFLNSVIEELNLKNIEAIHGRAEELAKNSKYREQYDLCVSRAVANMSTLSEYCLPFVSIGGYFIPYKSEKISEELNAAKKALLLLGGSLKEQVEFMLPASDIYRNLVVVKKEKPSPKKFPRKAGMPAKEPLC
ncbi:MAG: 16S rRNA (guanine(527)-N(7))-methyltransferase RsmG [Lachnospiraceae bacterium]|nr:16S rRNA (guanine(527)-N(7))-methyltransferase RsmG [Lachnospiraceae bacterium]